MKRLLAFILLSLACSFSSAATLVNRHNTVQKLRAGSFSPAASYIVVVYRMGAIASSTSSGGTFTVFSGHAIKAGDKIGIWSGGATWTYSGTATVSSVTATSVVMSAGSYTVAVGDMIVPLGVDSGTGAAVFTASDLPVYNAASSSSTAFTNSRVTANGSGEYSFYSLARAWWEVVLRSGSATVVDVVAHRASPEVTPFEYGYAGAGTSASSWTGWEAVISNQSVGGVDIYFPAGWYSTSTQFAIGYSGLLIRGDRPSDEVADADTGTIILFTGTSKTLLSFGVFTSSPANFYVGTGPGYRISDIQFRTNEGAPGTFEGVRTNSCIKDNGSGSGIVNGVTFDGWQYGYAMPYGGDGNNQSGVLYSRCDVGLYMGPGSQQNVIIGPVFSTCREGYVNEGAKQGGLYSPNFTDQKVADAVFAGDVGTTRFGLSGSAGKELNFDIWNPWFESDANVGQGRIPPRHVYLTSGSPRYVRLHDVRLISGGAASADNAFLEMDTGTRVEIENIIVEGNQVKWIVKRAVGLFGDVLLINPRTVDGYTTTAFWGKNGVADTTAGRTTIKKWQNNGLTAGSGAAEAMSLLFDGATADGTLTYDDTTQQWTLSHTLNMSGPILMAAGQRIDAYRVQGNKGTAQVSGDFALHANWGAGATVAVTSGSRDPRFEVTVTAAGTPGANPTVTLTFKDGAWTAAPFATCQFNGGTGTTLPITWTSTATTLVMTYPGTPVAASTYKIACQVQG